jgi:c-di-GMP-binding flagellar brake protein YcgR
MLKIGDVLTLELKYSDKDEKFKCKLVERGGPHLYIDYPINIETNRTAFFIDGTQLKCSFVHDNSVYWFETEVVGRVKQNIPMIMLSYPGDDQLMKIQRRQYVRVETPVDVAVHPANFEFSPFVTITDDISAGGAAILISNRLTVNPGQLIHTWLVLPMQNGEYHYLKLVAKVVRVIPGENGRNKASLEFVEVDSHHRQLLLRFCFDRQVVMRKKGLLEQSS